MADLQKEASLDRLKGRIRSTWADITDDDVDQVRGDIEQLAGRIKDKTGESVEAIRDKLESFMADESGDHIQEEHEREDGHGQPGGTHYQ